MRAGDATRTKPAIERARRVWKDTTSQVYRAAVQRHGVASSWLKDHGTRPSRGGKAADQLARLAQEMSDAGFSVDAIDAALMEMVRGIAHVATGTRPAA